MSLINCPECGTNNVSDSAERCPRCGYSIKEYLLASQQKELYERKRQEAWQSLLPELKQKYKEISELTPPPEPRKPKIKNNIFSNKGGGLSLISWVLIASLLFAILTVSAQSTILVILLIIFMAIGIPFAMYMAYLDYHILLKEYNDKHREWQSQVNDWDNYIKEMQELLVKKYKRYAHNIAVYETKEPKSETDKNNHEVKCPICNSKNIIRISDFDRVLSIYMIGLASSKIGKQYECKSCRHKW